MATVTRFRLKSGISFVAEGTRYLVLDTETQSTFRVGQTEYLLLMQFEETRDAEDVCYQLNSQHGLGLTREALWKFIAQAIKLNLLKAHTGSLWSRIGPSSSSMLRFKLFDPSSLLTSMINHGRFLAGRAGLAVALTLVTVGGFLFAANLGEVWAFRSLAMPRQMAVPILAVVLLSIGHEMAHGLAGKWHGFDVTEVGFHFHYFLPTFYCKVFHHVRANRQALLHVLLAGCVFDLLAASLLVMVWRLIPGPGWIRDCTGTIVTLLLMKVILLQLNPIWPLSDGFRVVQLFAPKKTGGSLR
jgi:hypothetical protein